MNEQARSTSQSPRESTSGLFMVGVLILTGAGACIAVGRSEDEALLEVVGLVLGIAAGIVLQVATIAVGVAFGMRIAAQEARDRRG